MGVEERRGQAMNFVPDPPEAPFTASEYGERLDRLRAAMARDGIDLLYLTSSEALYYLSGYRAIWYQTLALGGWEPISGIAVQRDADAYIHIECDREQALTNLTALSRDVRIWPLGEGDFLDFILGEIGAAGWLSGTLGLELSHYRPYPAASNRLRAGFEGRGCRVVDGTGTINAVRRRKSPQEMAYTRKAAEICDIGMRTAVETARPGITELELYGEIVRAVSKAGGEVAGITLPVQSGHRTIASHCMPSRRVIEAGDVLNVDVAGVYNRYHADGARTFSMGEPAPALAELVAVSAASFAILDEALAPDVPMRDVLPRLEDHYRSAGIWGSQRWTGGYELGAAFPPDWVGAMSYTVGEETGEETFPIGLVANYESNFYLPHRPGMSMLIDTLVVEEDWAGFIHTVPHDLIVIE